MPDLDAIFGIATNVFALLSLISAAFSGKFSKQALETVHRLLRNVGHADPRHTRPTTGATLTAKVESLDDNQHVFIRNQSVIVENQVLIAQTLRTISDDLASVRGTGKRRLPTDSINIQEIVDEQRLRDGNADDHQARME